MNISMFASQLLRKVLSDVRKRLSPNTPNAEKTGKEMYEIHLSGLFQTDDRIALREIVRQLCLERELEGQRLVGWTVFVMSADRFTQ